MATKELMIISCTPNELIYLYDYSQLIKGYYWGIACLLFIPVYSAIFIFYKTMGFSLPFLNITSILITGGIALLPPLLLFTLIQKVGFSERWTFNRSLGKILIERKLLFGKMIASYPSAEIKSVKFEENTESESHPSDRYQVILISKTVNLWGQGNKCHRVIYSSMNSEKAQNLAALIQEYLHTD